MAYSGDNSDQGQALPGSKRIDAFRVGMHRLSMLALVAASMAPSAALAQSANVGVSDANGPDDEQEQSDLTSVELVCSTGQTSTLPLSVQLDPVANSGGNSSDISILFDTDGDGNANYSYVITLSGDPFVVEEINMQRGRNDSSPIKLSGNKTAVAIGTTNSSTSIGTNPFDGGQDTSVDLDLDLSVIAAHAGVAIEDVDFLNITTIPSSSATSDPKDVLLAVGQAFTADDSDATDVDTTVTIDAFGNDSDRVDWSTAQITSPPSHGTATINADGTITYVPDGDFTGVDTLTYSAIGIDCATYTSTVTITITGIAAVDDTATVAWLFDGIPGVFNVWDNDSIDGAAASSGNTTLAVAPGSTVPSDLTFDSSTGLVGVAADSTPGTYSFDYQLCRISAPTDCKIATATVIIEPAEADFAVTKSNGTTTVTSGLTTTYTVDVTNNGSDPVGGAVITDAPGPGITCSASAPVTITGDGVPAGSFTFADLSGPGITFGTLANGESATLTYTCDVD